MAKKARRKLEEEEEAAAFEFPVFDEVGFVTKEFEMTTALSLTASLAVLVGILCWVLTVDGVPWFGGFALGLLAIVGTPFLLQRIRARASLYTKGDWAGLIVTEFFGWLALWFVLANVSPHAV